MIAVLVVDGYLAYLYFGRIADQRGASTDTLASEVVQEKTTEPRFNEAVIVHKATSQNIVDNSTYIDHPSTTKNPKAVLLITQALTPDGEATTNAHEVGVWYDRNRGGRWAIFNQDLAPMPKGAVFNVVVWEEPTEAPDTAGAGNAVFVHRITSDNTVDDSTYIDHPLTNQNPDVAVSVTSNWNPGGGAGTYSDHPVGVLYDADRERWAIVNEDGAPTRAGASFNVAVYES